MHEIKQNTFLKQKDKLLGFIRTNVFTVEEADDILPDVFYQFIDWFNSIQPLDRVVAGNKKKLPLQISIRTLQTVAGTIHLK